jgi:hypothetical protein
MARGVPKNGFRLTKKRLAAGWSKPDNGIVHFHTQKNVVETKVETDAEIDIRIRERFEVLESMTKAAVRGKAPAIVVSGPAGLGKSFSVERIVKGFDPDQQRSTFVKGYVRPTGLFRTLYNFRHKGNVIVFDDADSIFGDETSLNLLKAACDTADERFISYMVETNLKDEEDEKIPKTFQFEGTIVFITNYDFDHLIDAGNKLAPHLQALISRTHYIDLMMKTRRDYVVRIKQVLGAGMLKDKGFTEDEEGEIIAFIETNIDKLRELSLRMVLKIASLMDINPTGWEKTALATCCKQK